MQTVIKCRTMEIYWETKQLLNSFSEVNLGLFLYHGHFYRPAAQYVVWNYKSMRIAPYLSAELDQILFFSLSISFERLLICQFIYLFYF